MREFFFRLLQELEKLTGIKQWERLAGIEDPDLRKREINTLLDILCQQSDLFPLIPKNDQKAILRHSVISDGDFIGLNAKFVYKSLNAQKDKFFKEAAHIPIERDPDWKPVEGEARQEWLNKWLRELQGFEPQIVRQSHVKELEATLPPKEKGIIYQSTGPEEVFQRQMHLLYVRENYDPITREKLPTWEEESVWLEKQNKK